MKSGGDGGRGDSHTYRLNRKLLDLDGGRIDMRRGQNRHAMGAESTCEGAPIYSYEKKEKNEKNGADAPSPIASENRKSKKERSDRTPYTPEFEIAWSKYPSRLGSNPKDAAAKAFNLLRQDGVGFKLILAAVEAYNRFAWMTEIAGTEYVMGGKRFFKSHKDPQEDEWRRDWIALAAAGRGAAQEPRQAGARGTARLY